MKEIKVCKSEDGWYLARCEEGVDTPITSLDAFDTEAKAIGAKAFLMGPDFYRPPSMRRHYR